MRRRFSLLLVLVLALSAASSATPRPRSTGAGSPGRSALPYMLQHAGHAEPHQLSVAVDGAVDPGLIPDELAWSHFLRAMAGASSAARQAALAQASLEAGDRAAFIAALGTLGPELDTIAQQRKAGGASLPAAAHEQLKRREGEAVAGARQRVELALSGAGWAQLDAHIRDRVKRHIRIYRGPMPPPGGAAR